MAQNTIPDVPAVSLGDRHAEVRCGSNNEARPKFYIQGDEMAIVIGEAEVFLSVADLRVAMDFDQTPWEEEESVDPMPNIEYEGGPLSGQEAHYDRLPTSIAVEGDGVYQRTDQWRGGRCVYRWQPMTSEEADRILGEATEK